MKTLKNIIRLVKVQHALFAMPFTLSAFILAEGSFFSFEILWILGAFFCARSFGMAINRLVDAPIDCQNPRTAHRLLACGQMKKTEALLWISGFGAGLLFFASKLNPLALKLSPVCFFFLILYPYAKKFTWLAHVILGLILSMAPLGVFIAMKGEMHSGLFWLCLAILFWVSGFDIIYSLQDLEFDLENGLFSVPTRFGVKKALLFSFLLHLFCGLFFIVTTIVFSYHPIAVLLSFVIPGVLFWEHYLIRQGLEKNLHFAFFRLNSAISIYFFVLTILGTQIPKGSL